MEVNGSENESLFDEMESAIKLASLNQNIILKELLSGTSKNGALASKSELRSLVIWDKYLSWLVENPNLGKTPSPLVWRLSTPMILIRFKVCLEKIKRKLLKREVICCLGESWHKSRSRKDTITQNLPPYLWDLVEERKEPYPDWKPNYIKNSRKHMNKIKDWLVENDRQSEWDEWLSELIDQDATFQKLEWQVGSKPIKTAIKDDLKRVKRRLNGRLIQFRPSGVRISKGNRHPALVAIGQVPVLGSFLRRPPWQTLAKLQSIPEEFAIKNPKLFGDSAESGNSGEPIKRLGNAVNVELVKVIAGVLSAILRASEQ